jgi:hypothetical protein
MTDTTAGRAKRVPISIPTDFPQANRLGDTQLFEAILGIASSTFARWLAEKRLPTPIKIGRLNKWPEAVMARVQAEGVPSA